jgi:hypothetical protein
MSVVVSDYASLTAAIANWTHRSDLTSGSPPFSDGFIQQAQAQIEKDIPLNNFGNYIRWQESGFLFGQISGGVYPVPSDWLGPKNITVLDGSSGVFPLDFRNVNWLLNTYWLRQAQGRPKYMARQNFGSATLTASIANGTLSVTGVSGGTVQPGQILSDSNTHITETLSVTGLGTGTGGTGTYSVSDSSLSVSSESMSASGSVFIFGPYPDNAYQVQGTYYASAPLLSSTNTTNWMVVNTPALMLAACMVEAAKFLENDAMLQRWQGDYNERLTALVNADKAERWAASTVAVEAG